MLRRQIACLAISLPMLTAADFTPPPTRAVPVTETLHGVTLSDPYRWLEDQNSAETRQWIAARS